MKLIFMFFTCCSRIVYWCRLFATCPIRSSIVVSINNQPSFTNLLDTYGLDCVDSYCPICHHSGACQVMSWFELNGCESLVLTSLRFITGYPYTIAGEKPGRPKRQLPGPIMENCERQLNKKCSAEDYIMVGGTTRYPPFLRRHKNMIMTTVTTEKLPKCRRKSKI